MQTINLKNGFPSVGEARRHLLDELTAARSRGVRVLKIIHGWGSSGEGGALCHALRRSLRLRVKEGKVTLVVPGERFSTDTLEGKELLERHPALRRDPDCNRSNPGITLVELPTR